jgi:pimeloyl-ACP methyl ester carboxylesterase
MDHLGIREFMVLGFCIGGPFIWNLLKRAGDRVVAAVPAQPSGYRPEMPGLSYNNNMEGWGPELCARRPDITMAMVDTFLTNMYRGARADFVYTVTRDFVRNCQTPILVLPDDVPAHPYAVAMETVHLAPNAQVTLYPWKDTPDKIPPAVRHIRTFLRAHRPVSAAQSMAVAARGCVKTLDLIFCRVDIRGDQGDAFCRGPGPSPAHAAARMFGRLRGGGQSGSGGRCLH